MSVPRLLCIRLRTLQIQCSRWSLSVEAGSGTDGAGGSVDEDAETCCTFHARISPDQAGDEWKHQQHRCAGEKRKERECVGQEGEIRRAVGGRGGGGGAVSVVGRRHKCACLQYLHDMAANYTGNLFVFFCVLCLFLALSSCFFLFLFASALCFAFVLPSAVCGKGNSARTQLL